MPRKNTGPRLEWRQDRSVFEIIWFERGSRRRQSTGTSDAETAREYYQGFLAQKPADNRPSHPDARYIGDVLACYLEEKGPDMTIKGLKTLKGALKPLIDWWGDKPAGIVNERACRLYVKDRATKTTAAPRFELAYLRAALNYDWRMGRLLQKIPVWVPALNKPKDRFLSRGEAARLLWASRHRTPLPSCLPPPSLLGVAMACPALRVDVDTDLLALAAARCSITPSSFSSSSSSSSSLH